MKWYLTATILLALVVGGCNEAQQVPQQRWGQGELPEDWQNTFGNDNLARLNFAQTQRINQHQALIFGGSIKDPNGQTVRKRGFIERITTLEALEDRVRKLEKANMDTLGASYDELHNKEFK